MREENASTSVTRLLLATFAAAAIAGPAAATTFSLARTFDDPTATTHDFFGRVVALDGNYVLVSADGDDTNGNDVGQAYLFDLVTGALLHTFDDPTVTPGDRFGSAATIDGNFVLIGAPLDDTNGFQVGQAHLFDAVTGALLRTFDDPTITGADAFGDAVALDGNNVLIGATRDDTSGGNVGQAHLFDATTGALLQTFDDPTITAFDSFGVSVAIHGNNVLIGDSGDDTNGLNAGQAHLFDATTGALLHTFDDPTITLGDGFGFAVALDGSYVLIGDPLDDTNGNSVGQAHLFDAVTGAWLRTFDDPTITAGDRFGISVDIDGDNVLIGAFFDDTLGQQVGQAYLFSASTGALLHTFDDPTVTNGDRFGLSVAIDGGNVLVGAHGDDTNGTDVGQAHLFSVDVPEPAPLLLLGGGLVLVRLGTARRTAAARNR